MLVAAARLAPAAPGATDPLVERVFDEIEATFRQPVSARDVARAVGYTPGHLTTVVRERTGRTLLEWITARRMTEVRRMLRETDLPLGVVAARTGPARRHLSRAVLPRPLRHHPEAVAPQPARLAVMITTTDPGLSGPAGCPAEPGCWPSTSVVRASVSLTQKRCRACRRPRD